MEKPRTVAILSFPRCQALDVTGPAAVFGAGNDKSGQLYYDVQILSAKGGPIKTNSAIAFVTKSIEEVPPESVDTLLIVGGDDSGLLDLAEDETVRRWTLECTRTARRYGSVCSGTFVLAHFGLFERQARGDALVGMHPSRREMAGTRKSIQTPCSSRMVRYGHRPASQPVSI